MPRNTDTQFVTMFSPLASSSEHLWFLQSWSPTPWILKKTAGLGMFHPQKDIRSEGSGHARFQNLGPRTSGPYCSDPIPHFDPIRSSNEQRPLWHKLAPSRTELSDTPPKIWITAASTHIRSKSFFIFYTHTQKSYQSHIIIMYLFIMVISTPKIIINYSFSHFVNLVSG